MAPPRTQPPPPNPVPVKEDLRCRAINLCTRLDEVNSRLHDIRARLFGGECVAEQPVDSAPNVEDSIMRANVVVTRILEAIDSICTNL